MTVIHALFLLFRCRCFCCSFNENKHRYHLFFVSWKKWIGLMLNGGGRVTKWLNYVQSFNRSIVHSISYSALDSVWWIHDFHFTLPMCIQSKCWFFQFSFWHRQQLPKTLKVFVVFFYSIMNDEKHRPQNVGRSHSSNRIKHFHSTKIIIMGVRGKEIWKCNESGDHSLFIILSLWAIMNK